MRTDTQPLTENIPEDVENADRWVTVFDVQPDETYTARIVSALTDQDIFDTTEDADPAAPPSDVTVSQPLPFTIPRYIQSAGNPPLAAKCGLDFGLVLDSSGSIGNAISSLKTAANGFVDALVDTGSHVSQVSFATRSPGSGGVNIGPTALTAANLATIKSSYFNLRTDDRNNNRTNWEDGLLKSQQTFTFPPPGPGTSPGAPDLVIVITDGNPNTIGSGQRVREGSPAAVNPAIRIANQMKAAGAHMFVVAVGRNVSEAPIKAISGQERLNSDGSNFATAGFTTTTDYVSLADTLKRIAVDLCAPSLTITKEAQRPGSPAYLPADGWTFETTVRLNGGSGSWVNPGTDAIPADSPSTKSQVTSNSGAANFQWKPSGDITSDVRIREIPQAGFTRQPALVCNARNALTGATRPITVQADGNGVWDLASVPDGILGSREIVTCTAQNNLDFAKLTVVKDAAGSPQDFGFTGAITQAIATPDARFPNTFTLDDDTSSATPKQTSWEQLSPGTYVITEDTLPAGWRLDDITITGGQLTKDLDTRTATVVLDAGDDATVTFRNRNSSTLTVTKAFTVPAGLTLPDGFTFTIPVQCTGLPDRDVVFTKAEIDAGQLSETISDIPVGTVCSFDETLPLTPIEGWTWGDPTFSPESKSVTVVADASQNVATVTNTIFKPGLTLDKVADVASVSVPGETIVYTFTATNTGNVTLTDVRSPTRCRACRLWPARRPSRRRWTRVRCWSARRRMR